MGSDPYAPYRKTLLSPDELKELSQPRPFRVVRDTTSCWVVIVTAWVATAICTTWWIVLLAIPLIGSRYYALSIIAHDGLHRRLFRRRRTNDLYCDALLLGPIGAITRLNNRNHLEHHRHLSTAADPDRHKHCSYNKTTRARVLLFLTGLPSAYAVFRNVFVPVTRTPAKTTPAPPATRTHVSRYAARDVVILVAWQTTLIVGLTWAIGWWAYPILWILPVYVFQYCADLVRSFLEHAHPEDDGVADEHRLITFESSPLERWFVAPMNMNYHTVHHLWTSIPYYNLPEADRRVRHRPGAETLIWRGSYLGYLLAYCAALPISTSPAPDSERDARALETGWKPRHVSSTNATHRGSAANP